MPIFSLARRARAVALLASLFLAGGAASLNAATRLRDIAVAPLERSAKITILLGENPATVVTEIVAGNAQVRLRPVEADREALTSARVRAGVRGIAARIERRDVLVVDVDFERTVTALRVIRRERGTLIVEAKLGAVTARPRATAAAGRSRRAWSLRTIVIDPGHGGKDPGASAGSIVEKSVVLDVARALRRELQRRMPGVRVVMTRTDDRFVELYRRGQIANESDGRLFISIHCNSLPDTARPAHGFECYILRPDKSGDAARVVAEENGAIRFETDRGKYDAMSAESVIVSGMAQSAFARYSEHAAQSIRAAMRAATPLADRGVHQAGFFVLVGASMPAVLLEIGYLSSPHDLRTLRSVSGRKTIARAIARGIVDYEKIYSESLE